MLKKKFAQFNKILYLYKQYKNLQIFIPMNKSTLFLLLCCCISFQAFAQTNIELNIQHKFGKSSFVKGQTYIDNLNRAVLINDIEYYISNIELIHDGGQTDLVQTPYFLVHNENYTASLGTTSSTIQELEFFNFNLGIDATANSTTPNSHPAGHPLAAANMYSQDEQSYVFVAIRGMVDTDNDQIPDRDFNLRATGNQLLRPISIEATTGSVGNFLKISLIANIASWLKEIDLDLVGLQENAGADNEKLCDNTDEQLVFSNVGTTNVSTIVSPQNQIFIDSRLSYAPTIHYKFFTNERLDMTITNLNGSYFIQRFDLAPDGDFYMSDNLASGVYIVIFTSPKGIRQCKKFVVRN